MLATNQRLLRDGYLSLKSQILAVPDLKDIKGTENLSVDVLAYQCIFCFCFDKYFLFVLLLFLFTICPNAQGQHILYLVPCISSFHIVYFCGMYMLVEMQICVFIFNLQYMYKC